MMNSVGVQGAFAPPHAGPLERPFCVQRLAARKQRLVDGSYHNWSPPPALIVAIIAPVTRLKNSTVSGSPNTPWRQDTARSVPGPSAMPVGSQLPSGNIFQPLPGVMVGMVSTTGATGVPVRIAAAGMTSTSPRGFAVLPSLLT